MKSAVFAIALALTLSIFLAPLGAGAVPQIEVRVRLQKELDFVEVSGYSLRISAPSNFISIAIEPGGFQRAKIRRLRPGLWLVKYNGVPKPERIESARVAVRGQMLRVGVVAAPHDLEIIKNPSKGLDVVSRLDLNTYLMGVLPSEMPITWPLEALKAQAVAARSFVMRMAYERQSKYFDVDSSVFDQVYKFLSDAKSHPEWNTKLGRALDETRGEILYDARHRVLKAFYSADCGCQSEDPRFVWGKHNAYESVKDPTCGKRPQIQWNLSLKRQEVREKLIAALDLPPEANLRTVQVSGHTPSGRVAHVIAGFDVGKDTRSIAVPAQEFRRIFGFQKIQSADFTLRWFGEELKINGKGSGHGVGLCQTGSRALAEGGMGYRDILKLYYPRARFYTPKKT